jgi:hypothetical protein
LPSSPPEKRGESAGDLGELRLERR